MSDTEPVTPDSGASFRAPLVIIDDFLPRELATAMREDIDAHFAEPVRTGPIPTRSGIIGLFPSFTPICEPLRKR